MLVVAVFTAAVTARPDSAGIVELVKGFAYGTVAFYITIVQYCGPGSAVGIATGYGLEGQGIESRWGARISTLVQSGPGARPTSCTMGTGSFLRVKSGRGVTLTPHPLLMLLVMKE